MRKKIFKLFKYVTSCILAASLLLVSMPCSALCSDETDLDINQWSEQAVWLINQYRAENGLEPFYMAPQIQELSNIRSEELCQDYAHIRPNMEDWFSVIEESDLDDNCYAYENIAAGMGSPESVVNGWEHSQLHNEALLTTDCQYIGLSVSYRQYDDSFYFFYWEMLIYGCPKQQINDPYLAQEQTIQVMNTVTENTGDSTSSDNTDETVTTEAENIDADITMIGDLNQDGIISLADSVILERYILGQVIPENFELQVADSNADGIINNVDLLLHIQYQMHAITSLPPT